MTMTPTTATEIMVMALHRLDVIIRGKRGVSARTGRHSARQHQLTSGESRET